MTQSLAETETRQSPVRPSAAETLVLSTVHNKTKDSIENTTRPAKSVQPPTFSAIGMTGQATKKVKPSGMSANQIPGKGSATIRMEEGRSESQNILPTTEAVKAALPAATLNASSPPIVASIIQQASPIITTDKEKLISSVFTDADIDAITSAEVKTNTTPSTSILPRIVGLAETPMMISRQMAEALQRLPDRPIEISLNPSELGKIRMSVSAAEASITVSVLVERPETLELMRRNIDVLTKEFQLIGYESINFAFSGGNSQNASDQDHEDPSNLKSVVLDVDGTSIDKPTRKVQVQGLDLRL